MGLCECKDVVMVFPAEVQLCVSQTTTVPCSDLQLVVKVEAATTGPSRSIVLAASAGPTVVGGRHGSHTTA